MPIAPGTKIGAYEIQAPLGGRVLGSDEQKRRHMSSVTRITVLAILLVLPAHLLSITKHSDNRLQPV